MEEIFDVFREYDTDTLVVTDFGITADGMLVTHIHNNGGKVEIWCGNPDEDKFAEELILSKSERERIFEEICDLM